MSAFYECVLLPLSFSILRMFTMHPSYLRAWEASYCSGEDGGVMPSLWDGAALSWVSTELKSRLTTPASCFCRFAFGAATTKSDLRYKPTTWNKHIKDKNSDVLWGWTHWWADHPAGALCQKCRLLDPSSDTSPAWKIPLSHSSKDILTYNIHINDQ